MSFLDDLKVEREEVYDFEGVFNSKDIMGFRTCKWLRINDELSLSIQASNMHYCTPRVFTDLDKYTHFEMAIILNDKLNYNPAPLKDFYKFDKLMEYYEGGVFAYVDKELLEELYIYCKENL